MARIGVVILALISQSAVLAQPRTDPVAQELAVQAALLQGRQSLTQGDAKQAVAVLEAKLPFINGNLDFLATLREAYAELARDLQLKRLDDQAEAVRQKLRVLEQGLKPKVEPPVKARAKGDPFQQVAIMEGASNGMLDQATAAFQRKDYAAANRLFAQVKEPLGPHATDWAYCRLWEITRRLNAENPDDASVLSSMEREVGEAMKLVTGMPAYRDYGAKVLNRIRELQGRPTIPVVPSGWTATVSANFRVLSREASPEATTLLSHLEKARSAAFEKWYGAPSGTWTVRCDVYLHARSDDYTKATGKDARWQGHSSLEIVDRKVTARRIDVVGDATELAEAVLPREVTHVVLADIFPDPLLPRWADEAMAILAAPRPHVERYLAALPKVARDGKLFTLSQLMATKEFPEASAITAFYVQSVSLVDVLVAERGAQHFALFLQQANRYGFEKALKDNYGIKNFAALQEHWQKRAFSH